MGDMDFPTAADLYRIARTELLIDTPQITRLAAETPGTDVNGLLQAMAAVGDAVVGHSIAMASTFFLSAAKGDKLSFRLLDHIGLLRKPAAVALCSVDFETDVAALAAFTIPADSLLSTEDGIQWVTTHSAEFPKGSVGPLNVRVRSELAGKDQYALPHTISSIVTQIVGAPADLRVTNTKASTLGDDEQEDPEYRSDGQRFFDTARRGVLSAIEARALRVPGVKTAVATETLDVNGTANFIVLLGITDRFTELLIDQREVPAKYHAQSQVLAQTVFDELADTRAAGVPVFVQVASVVIQAINLNLTFVAGADVNDVAYRSRVAIVNRINVMKRGEILSRKNLSDALKNVRGLYITGSEIAYPIGDGVPRPLEVFRTSLQCVTANSLQPDRPLTLSVTGDAFV